MIIKKILFCTLQLLILFIKGEGIYAAPLGKSITRIKDIIEIQGVRSNMLVGYGLVVGLNGTGDSLNKSPFTRESLTSMLERMGINTRGKALDTKNTAAVVVTASLPPFARHGSKIDLTISSLGDAKSLLGGTLLVTPLLGADGEVYAVGQGSVLASGFSASSNRGSGTSITKGVPTSGYIPNGAIVEREIKYNFNQQDNLIFSLRNPDFTTAQRIANTINKYGHNAQAKALDSSTIEVKIPPQYRGDVVPFITLIESLKVEPDQVARVILDDREGIIVINENVRISPVAIAHGSLVIKVTENTETSQPEPLSGGVTKEEVATTINVMDGSGKQLGVLKTGTTLRELVDGLNALGTTPRDTISILQSIKAAGALQAEIQEV